MSKAYRDNFKLITWEPIKSAAPKRAQERAAGFYFLPDITPFISPMSRRIISSRKHLRDEEIAYNVKQVGNDLKVTDYDNSSASHERISDRAVDAAFRRAAEKVWG